PHPLPWRMVGGGGAQLVAQRHNIRDAADLRTDRHGRAAVEAQSGRLRRAAAMSPITSPATRFGLAVLLALVVAGAVVALRGFHAAGSPVSGASLTDTAPTAAGPSALPPSQAGANSESHAGSTGDSNSAVTSSPQARQATDAARRQLLARANQGDL